LNQAITEFFGRIREEGAAIADDRAQQLRLPRADDGAAWTSRLSGDDRSRAAFDHNSITPRVRGTSNVTWFAEDVELDFAKTASKGNLSGGNVLIAEEDYGVIAIGLRSAGLRAAGGYLSVARMR
jgi:hypothetical protein